MDNFFYKTKVKEHEFIKNWFLEEYQDYIDSFPATPLKTDFHHKADRPYGKRWKDLIRPYIKSFTRQWGVEDYSYYCWVSQYELGVQHQWHIHPRSHFASVYYMELPNNENSTEFWKMEFPAEEGDLIFFPAWWIHRSAPNIYNKRKTVIAGNIIFNNHAFLP